jgi:hypothetical protein
MKKALIGIVLLLIIFFGYSFCFNSTKDTNNEAVKNELNLEKILLENGYVKIPLSKENSGHLQLTISINGVEGNFILDTGANSTAIDEKSMKKFKMKSKPSEEFAVSAGVTDIALQISTENTLLFDSIELKNHTVYLMKLDIINETFLNLGMTTIDGIIGTDILSENEAIIDYSKLTLYLKK